MHQCAAGLRCPAQAQGEGWVRSDVERGFHLEHWVYDRERIDGFDYDIGAVLIRTADATDESELISVLNAWDPGPAAALTDGPKGRAVRLTGPKVRHINSGTRCPPLANTAWTAGLAARIAPPLASVSVSVSVRIPQRYKQVSHPDARLTVHGRRLLVERVRAGRPVAHVADEMGISRTTDHKWVRRRRAEGGAGLYDRSSRPLTTPHRTSAEVESRICELRRDASSAPHASNRSWPCPPPSCPDPPPAEPAALDGPADGPAHSSLRTRASRRTGPRRHQEAWQHPRRRRPSDHAPPASRKQSAGNNRRPQGRQSRDRILLRPHRSRRSLPTVERGPDRRTLWKPSAAAAVRDSACPPGRPARGAVRSARPLLPESADRESLRDRRPRRSSACPGRADCQRRPARRPPA